MQAAQKLGIKIPTSAITRNSALRCLSPVHGGSGKPLGSTKFVVSCVYPVENNLVVRTRSEKVDKIRKMILELCLLMPGFQGSQSYAQEYADKDRFEKELILYSLCLCVSAQPK